MFLCPQTLAAHKKLNCCSEILPESFDQLKTLASNKDGLLYGVPVSIKENLEYKVVQGWSPPQLTSDGHLHRTFSWWHAGSAALTDPRSFDCLHTKDHDTSCGVVVNLDRPAKRHSVIVEVLKRQGAVPFVKTNLPQALLRWQNQELPETL